MLQRRLQRPSHGRCDDEVDARVKKRNSGGLSFDNTLLRKRQEIDSMAPETAGPRVVVNRAMTNQQKRHVQRIARGARYSADSTTPCLNPTPSRP
jgi:hypothetical protein